MVYRVANLIMKLISLKSHNARVRSCLDGNDYHVVGMKNGVVWNEKMMAIQKSFRYPFHQKTTKK